MGKLDQIRALRERNYAERKAEPAPRPVNNVAVINEAETVINTTKQPLPSNASRQAKWRAANAELNRQRARDGMRKKRATAKQSG